MNILQNGPKLYFSPVFKGTQFRKYAEKSEKPASSYLIGRPVGIDINNLDAHKNNMMGDLYERSCKALSRSSHSHPKKRLYKHKISTQRKIQIYFKKTAADLLLLQEQIQKSARKSPKDQEFEHEIENVVLQIHNLFEKYNFIEHKN